MKHCIEDNIFEGLSREILLNKKCCIRFQAKGESMYPVIREGDFLIVEPINGKEARLGDIIFYHNSSGRINIHRIIKRIYQDDELAFITKGDNI